MTTLTELLARVEAATGPDRELDRLLAKQFGWHRVEPRNTTSKKGGWIAPEDFMGLNSDGSPRLDSLHGTTIWSDVPRLTASLDAALALADRVLPGWDIELSRLGGAWRCGLGDPLCGWEWESASAPLATLGALIRALIATNQEAG